MLQVSVIKNIWIIKLCEWLVMPKALKGPSEFKKDFKSTLNSQWTQGEDEKIRKLEVSKSVSE